MAEGDEPGGTGLAHDFVRPDDPERSRSTMAFLEDMMDHDTAWNVVALLAAGLGAIAVRNLLEAAWERVNDEEPPQNPAARSTTWPQALAWTAASGLAVGLGRLIAQRGAAAGWKKVSGHYPKGLA
jgi:hypothetical protein